MVPTRVASGVRVDKGLTGTADRDSGTEGRQESTQVGLENCCCEGKQEKGVAVGRGHGIFKTDYNETVSVIVFKGGDVFIPILR